MKEGKKGFILIPLSIVLVGALIFGGGIKSAMAKPGKKIPKEIRIGDTVSYTGPYAAFGQTVFGVKAAVQDINKMGGIYVKEYGKRIPVKYITVDVASDPLKTGPLTEDLILREKVHFLGAHLEVPTMRSGTLMMAEMYKIPTVTGVGPYESWKGILDASGKPLKYTFTYSFHIGAPFPPGDFREGKKQYIMMETWFGALEKFGALTNKKVAAFALDDPDGRAWYMAFTGAAIKMGYDCYRAKDQFGVFPPGTTDFTSVIQEWKASGCEVLWGNCPGPDFGILWRQAHVLGFKPKLVFSTRAALFYRDISAWGGDLPHGVGMETFWSPSIQGVVGIGDTTPQSFAERWFKEIKEPLNQGIGWDYHGAQILFDGIKRAGTLDADAVVKALGETDMMTIAGRAVFEKETQYQSYSCQFGQWRKVDKPWKWEAPIVFSFNEMMPATTELIFPMPYD